MTAADEAPRPPAGDVLRRHALRVAITQGQYDQAKRTKDGAREAAAITFAAARSTGTSQQKVRLRDGTEVGLISIHKGGEWFTVDEDALTAVALVNDPGDFQDYLLPGAEHDPDVIALIHERFPDWVGTRIRPGVRQQYQAELEENGGQVLNRRTGEREPVAEVNRQEPSGQFTYKPGAKAWLLLEAAIEAGELTLDGEIVDPVDVPADQGEPAPESSGEPVDEDSSAR